MRKPSVMQIAPASQAMQYASVTPADMQHYEALQPDEHLQPYSTGQFHISEPFMPSATAAMQMDFAAPDGPFSALQHNPQYAVAGHDNTADQVKWYGSIDTGNHSHQAASNAATNEEALQYAVVRKTAPGNVSRHDTPTSVFDIFNSLSIVPGSAGQSYGEQHDEEGQEPALVDIPHMHDNNIVYHETEADDKWLEEFANSQVAMAQPVRAAAVQSPQQAQASAVQLEGSEHASNSMTYKPAMVCFNAIIGLRLHICCTA